MSNSPLLNSLAGFNSLACPRFSEAEQAELEAVMEGDRQFFLDHPEQDYYVRPITPIELLEGRSQGKAMREDFRVLVGEVAPGARLRLQFLGESLPVEDFKQAKRQIQKTMKDAPDAFKKKGKKRAAGKGFG
jgi:hypothetical protein